MAQPIISAEVKNTLSKIKTISDEINNGARLGHSGKKIENVVNIGIGGSHLGPEMVTESLSFYSQGIKALFHFKYRPRLIRKIYLNLSIQIQQFLSLFLKHLQPLKLLKMPKKVRKWFVEECKRRIH